MSAEISERRKEKGGKEEFVRLEMVKEEAKLKKRRSLINFRMQNAF